MLLGLYNTDTADTLTRARSAPPAELPPAFAESYLANYREARDFESSDALWRHRAEAVQRSLDAFEEATGEILPNPETAAPGPNREAVERFNQGRFDQIKAERPDLSLSYPADEERQRFAVEKARGVKETADQLAARPQTFGSFSGRMLGSVAGAMTDPLNIASMFFGAGAASGILRTAAVEAGIAAGSQAVIEAGTAPFKQQVDPQYGLADALENVAGAAAGGAVIGGSLKALGRGIDWWRGRNRSELPREVQDAANVLERDQEVRASNPLGATVTGEQAHAQAMTKAAQDIEAGRPVDVQDIVREAREIGDGYDRVRADPNGPADDPLIRIQPEDIESVIIGRGGFKGLGDVEVRGSGWGLVKFIWRHGENSKKAPELQITKDDLMAFPQVIREMEPTRPAAADGSRGREWRVELPGADGTSRVVVFADNLIQGRRDRHLVSAYVQEPGKPGDGGALSKRRVGPLGSSPPVLEPRRDEIQPESLLGLRGQRAGNDNVGPNASRVYTSSGQAIDVEYRAVEADSLISSHGADGSVNPAFPAELQPRDRTRLASQAQIADIAANLQPERLGRSPDAATGAPIIGPDGVVESGNGRVSAIRRAYEADGDSAARYREWVATQDLAAAEMRNPVLVAVRKTEMDPAGRAALARDANATSAARMSPTELALADARRLTDDALGRLTSGDVTAAGNRPFVRSFLDSLPASERGSLVDAGGALNLEGKKRLEGALLGRAYGDPTIIGRIVEDADSDIRAIGGALLDVAGPWARMRAAVARGEVEAGMDVTPDLLAAVRMVAEARASGRAVVELAQQMGLFGDDLSPTARLLLAGMFRDEALSKPAGRARVAEMLTGYLDEAGKNTAGPRLFGEPLTADQILSGERLTAESSRAIPEARPAEEMASAPDTQEALFQEVNRVMAARDLDVPVGESVDEAGKLVTLRRSAMDLMDEADRAIDDAATIAACAFGVAAE
ncbi:MAG: hypothetical protein ACLGJC_23060 [Alphaproteobacteria bacterium]